MYLVAIAWLYVALMMALAEATSTQGTVLGALSLVTSVQRMGVIDLGKLTPLVQRAAHDITVRIP